MKKILTGCFSLLILLAIAKVLVAQPVTNSTEIVVLNAMENSDGAMVADEVGNMTDEAGNAVMNEEMPMHEEGGY